MSADRILRALALVRHVWLQQLKQIRWAFAALLLTAHCLGATAAPNTAVSTGINGLWTTPAGDYTIFLQDSSSGSTFALELPSNLSSIRVWMGQGSSSQLQLQNLLNPVDLLSASISGSAMSGTRTVSGVQQPYGASLALAWVATEYTGVWQKSNTSNAYLVYCVLNTGAARLGVQIDLTIKADKNYAYDVYTGSFNGNVFNGVSIAGSGISSRLEFNGNVLAGTYTTLGRPPAVTPFSATHIVQLAP